MFKLIKILGAKNNVPELERFPTQGYYNNIEEGAAMEMVDGALEEATRTAHYIIADYEPTKKDYMLAYRVTPDMVFKVKVISENFPEVGMRVKPYKVGKTMQAVTEAEDGYGRVVATCDDFDYAYVKFDKIIKECEC